MAIQSQLARFACLIAAATLSGCGSVGPQASSPAGGPEPTVTTVVIQDVTATPINAGIDPTAIAVELSGKVLLGANPCLARDYKAQLTQETKNGLLAVSAQKVQISDPNHACTRERNPVYQTLSTTIRTSRHLVNDIIVRNVDTMGHDVSVSAL